MYGLNRDGLDEAVIREMDGFITAFKARFLLEHNEDGTHLASAAIFATDSVMPVGAMVEYAGATAPSVKWLICDGSAVSRVTYQALFGVIGTTYGVGNGTTTFNVPDRRGRFGIGKTAAGTGSVLGGTGGTLDHVHTGPSHTHTISTASPGTTTPSATVIVAAGVGTTVASDTHTHAGGIVTHDHGGVTGASGTGNTGSANPPFIAMNYLILATE